MQNKNYSQQIGCILHSSSRIQSCQEKADPNVGSKQLSLLCPGSHGALQGAPPKSLGSKKSSCWSGNKGRLNSGTPACTGNWRQQLDGWVDPILTLQASLFLFCEMGPSLTSRDYRSGRWKKVPGAQHIAGVQEIEPQPSTLVGLKGSWTRSRSLSRTWDPESS